MGALEFDELRHGGGHAELFGVGGVDSGDERLHESFEYFAAEAAAGERGNALVGRRYLSSSNAIGPRGMNGSASKRSLPTKA